MFLSTLLVLLAADPSAADYLARAQQADQQRQWDQAEHACSKALELEEELAPALYFRGRARFCLGKFTQSVADFDRYIEHNPAAASRQWERGISCYYAGKFEEGAKQFALYQTYHANDVENSVWRYLCMARMKDAGVAKARKAILPIRNDRRPGMMKIYDLYRGKATVADVLEAVKQGEPTKEQLSGRLFYARLYIGLYHEANENHEKAKEFLNKAATEHADDAAQDRINHYMYEVAVVHQKTRKKTP